MKSYATVFGIVALSVLYSAIGMCDDEKGASSKGPISTTKLTGYRISFTAEKLYQSVITKLENRLSKNSNDVEALYIRSGIYLKLGRIADSLTDLNASIDLHPGAPEGYFRRGYLWVLLEEHDKALSDLDRALEASPEHPKALALRARIQCEKNPKADVSSELAKALEIDPNDPFVRSQSAHVSYLKGAMDEALREISAAEALQEKYASFDPAIFILRFQILCEKGEMPKALDALKVALQYQALLSPEIIEEIQSCLKE
jgi:tetratricopeptide (TPR) repeat protein